MSRISRPSLVGRNRCEKKIKKNEINLKILFAYNKDRNKNIKILHAKQGGNGYPVVTAPHNYCFHPSD
jgi:hypothetical protein